MQPIQVAIVLVGVLGIAAWLAAFLAGCTPGPLIASAGERMIGRFALVVSMVLQIALIVLGVRGVL